MVDVLHCSTVTRHPRLIENVSSPPAHPYGRWLLVLSFIAAGANHFINPSPYLAMMPAYLPAHAALVWISGVAEVVGGLGVLWPRTRAFSGWGLILLLMAVFPANLQAALHGWPGVNISSWILWARLPLQVLLIAWVYRSCIARASAHQ